jgi:Uma2 family endonuclease
MPDVAFVRADRLPPLEEPDGFVPFPPDFAVEVVSPTDRFVDVAEKVAADLDGGVQLVWVIEPRRQTVTVHAADRSGRVLGTQDTLDGGDILPDFRVKVAE